MLSIPIVNRSPHPLPAYKTKDAAGMDLHAFLAAPLVVLPGERAKVPTGIQMAIPRGYEGEVRPRSGLADKHGVTVLNAPGTVDADYRGEIQVLLINLSTEPFTIRNGDRIAQLVVKPYSQVSWVKAADLGENTERGSGGFGSTGTA